MRRQFCDYYFSPLVSASSLLLQTTPPSPRVAVHPSSQISTSRPPPAAAGRAPYSTLSSTGHLLVVPLLLAPHARTPPVPLLAGVAGRLWCRARAHMQTSHLLSLTRNDDRSGDAAPCRAMCSAEDWGRQVYEIWSFLKTMAKVQRLQRMHRRCVQPPRSWAAGEWRESRRHCWKLQKVQACIRPA